MNTIFKYNGVERELSFAEYIEYQEVYETNYYAYVALVLASNGNTEAKQSAQQSKEYGQTSDRRSNICRSHRMALIKKSPPLLYRQRERFFYASCCMASVYFCTRRNAVSSIVSQRDKSLLCRKSASLTARATGFVLILAI